MFVGHPKDSQLAAVTATDFVIGLSWDGRVAILRRIGCGSGYPNLLTDRDRRHFHFVVVRRETAFDVWRLQCCERNLTFSF